MHVEGLQFKLPSILEFTTLSKLWTSHHQIPILVEKPQNLSFHGRTNITEFARSKYTAKKQTVMLAMLTEDSYYVFDMESEWHCWLIAIIRI